MLAAKLTGAGSKTNLSGTIAPGMRAVSVRSSDVAGVGGFVLPGDRVDVWLTWSVGNGEAAKSITQVLAENAVVLGVDQTSDQEADKPVVVKAVTVQVNPDQAQAISLAQSIGQISLALRQTTDNAALARKSTTVMDFAPADLRAAMNRAASNGAALSSGAKAKVRVRMTPGLTEVHVTRGVEATSYSVGGY